ncbi:non-specific lipid transfer protein GPI-anchored 11-like [Typha latifolia]|uniref:non-specific lipid transfer protein GPI-anchored 11-like n=1 Tax=Typha latifolia TaxID=4733 RepID=UPI003C2D87E3
MVGGKRFVWVVLFWLALAIWVDGADVAAPSPSMDCTSALLDLAGCLTFVEEGSKVAKPEGSCCSGLKKVVKEEVACLCEIFKGSQDFGVSLNLTKALTLPSACGVSTPPFSKCNISLAGVPGASPALSPSMEGETGGISPITAPSPAKSTAVEFAAPTFTPLASVTVALVFYYYL